MTCVMQVMQVSHAVIFTNVLKNTKTLHRQLANIFVTNILWLQRILQRILVQCTNKFDCLVYEMFFIHELRSTLNVQSDSIHAKVFNQLIISFFFVCLYCPFTPTKFLYFLHAYICLPFNFTIHFLKTEARSKHRVLPLIFIV